MTSDKKSNNIYVSIYAGNFENSIQVLLGHLLRKTLSREILLIAGN